MICAVQTYASLEQRVNYKRVSLADLLDELVFLHWRDQRERIAVKGSLPAVHGHQGQLQSLFLNVINNALLYNESKYPEVSVYTIELTSSSAIICIEDNGTGMDDQYVQSIFEPFSWLQSRDKYPGVGLGLAICQRIVNHHGGKLWCETELGQGSRFYIQLPIALHPAA